MTYTTQAVLLGYRVYREYDRIYRAYTEDFGKLYLIARGANKITSKLAGHLEPCTFSNLMVADGRGPEVLAQARTRISSASIWENPQKASAALLILEVLDALTHTHERDTRVFRLLILGLIRLRNSKDADYIVFVYHFLLRLLVYLGHAPDIKHKQKLQQLLVADISQDDIMMDDEARVLIAEYAQSALGEKQSSALFNFLCASLS
jgi:DNA repair protein RecO (recombination protein O)